MHPKRRTFRSLVLQPRRFALAALTVALLVALFALLAQVVDEQKRLREAPDDNLQWAVFQLQNEFNRAYRAVLEFDPQSTSSIDELKLSYDILYSRMELVSTAPTFAQVRSAAGMRDPLGRVSETIKSLTPVIDAAPAGFRKDEVAATFGAIQPTVQQVSLAALKFFTESSDEQRGKFALLLYEAAGILGLLLAAATAAVLLLIVQTQRIRRNEERLRESEGDLARAQKIAAVGSFRWDMATDSYRASDELRRIYGFAEDDRLDREASLAAIVPQDRARVTAAFAASLAHSGSASRPESSEIEYGIQRPDGTVRRVHDAALVEFDESGKAATVVGTIRDITEESRQREALAESERQLRMAQRLARVGSYSWDIATGQILWSDEVYRIYGLPPSKTLSIEGLSQYIHPDDREYMAAQVRNATREVTIPDSMRLIEHRLVRPDGSVRIAQSASEIERDDAGRPIRMIGTIRDVTTERLHEKALKDAKDEAERANRAKGEFLAVMSHEVRTPMNGVLGMLSALEDTALDDGQRKLCDVARSSAEALLVILNDILDASKIEAGKLELEPSPFELRPLMRSVVHLYGPQARAKGITLDSTIAGDLPAAFVGDAGRLRQMMLNYVSNAVKFTSTGEIIISARSAGRSPDGKPVLRLEVSDTGPGIPAEKHGEVFARFNQLDRTFARRFGGTGLGLAITKSLAELMGGRVGFTSHPGRGSTFWLEVPLDVAGVPSTAEGRAVAPVAASNGHLKILVAEDNATNQLVARMLLESLGHRVDVANDGLEAVEAARSRRYDLILMDISMPGLDGIEATRQIRALDGERASVPIYALTANALNTDKDTCLEAGMQKVLVKPLNKAVLAGAIAEVSPGSGQMQPGAATDGPIVDFDEAIFARLTDDVGQEAAKTLVNAFLADLGRRRTEALAAVAGRDLDGMRVVAHSLRGASAIVGAERLRRGAAEIENGIRTGTLSDPEAAWAVLEPLVQAAVEAIARLDGPKLGESAQPAPAMV